jgi:hypothetical protein
MNNLVFVLGDGAKLIDNIGGFMARESQVTIPDLDYDGARSADRTRRLPESAQAKLRALKRQVQRLADMNRPATERANEAFTAYRKREDILDRTRFDYQRGRLTRTVEFVDENGNPGRRVEQDDRALKQAEHDRDQARAHWEELKGEADAISSQWQGTAGLVVALEDWLKRLPRRTRILEYVGETPKLRKGETAQEALLRAERGLQALAVRRSELEAAPIASAELKQRIRAYVAELNAAATPDLSLAVLSGNPADIRYTMEAAPTHSITPTGDQISGHARVVDGVALLAWANPDLLIQRLEEEADALVIDDTDTATAEQRAAGLEEIEAERLALERDAEYWTVELERQGFAVHRRRDAAPEAVLGIEVEGISR